jgi:hypothetical protein
MWALSITASVGGLFNVLKHPFCFWIWTASNTGWLALKLRQRSWSEVLFCASNLATSVWGLVTW